MVSCLPSFPGLSRIHRHVDLQLTSQSQVAEFQTSNDSSNGRLFGTRHISITRVQDVRYAAEFGFASESLFLKPLEIGAQAIPTLQPRVAVRTVQISEWSWTCGSCGMRCADGTLVIRCSFVMDKPWLSIVCCTWADIPCGENPNKFPIKAETNTRVYQCVVQHFPQTLIKIRPRQGSVKITSCVLLSFETSHASAACILAA
ncbi:hypothetical protein LZ30DRAFT_430178 [Colletotrichum cereale]|nr:hypothetical protein LZ30DRAFT_430178 [Colletotrichum cereale]